MAMPSSAEQSRRRIEKFSERTKHVLNSLPDEAQRLNHDYIGTEHILLSLIKEESLGELFQALQMSPDKIKRDTEFIIDHNSGGKEADGRSGLTPQAKKVIELAIDETRRSQNTEITPIHLLIGILCEGQGVGSRVLKSQTKDSHPILLEKIRQFKPAVKKEVAELEIEEVEGFMKDRLGKFLRDPKIERDVKDSALKIMNEAMELAEKSEPKSTPSA